MKILVINAGSSSLKYQLIDMQDKKILAKGLCERIGIDGRFTHKTHDGRALEREIDLPDHKVAFSTTIDAITKGEYAVIESVNEIDAVGHRIVNGAEKFTESVLVTEKVLEDFESVINFAPLHNPPAMMGIKACRGVLGEQVPNVLVFDTTFHQTMPPKAFIFGVPFSYYEKYKIRRYGAHGTSHRYVTARCAKLMKKPPEDIKMISCHLGNGASIAAVNGGKCIDTSMGLTPLGGFIMGTRSGDLDPSVVTFIMRKEGISPLEMENMLNKRSGCIGISNISSDERDLLQASSGGHEGATLAQAIQRYQIKKFIGSYAAAMGGVDAIIFTGGIGENGVQLRRDVCDNMEFFGIKLDQERNNTTVGGKEGNIAADDAKTSVYVIPTDEEYMIALDTQRIVESLTNK